MTLILPPNYLEEINSLIFLAGPIQGAERWQDKAVEIIENYAADIFIASPRRSLEFDRTLKKGSFTKEDYNQQVDWETYHLKVASEKGTVMFWLAKEFKHYCGRPHGQTSRFELGEWKVKHEKDGINLIVGIEKGFTNERYIRRRFAQDCPDMPLCFTLEETCKEAIRLAKK